MFRNETRKVVTKAQAGTTRENSKSISPIPPVENIRDGDFGNLAPDFSTAPSQIVERRTVAIRSFSIPLEDEATYYFFHNFVSQDPASLQAYSHVLPVVYRQNSSFNALPKIIEAIGLAGISNVKQAPELMVAAGQKYARALRAITASIQDSKEASTDQTLITVMLLGLFEVLHKLRVFPSSRSDHCADCHMFKPRVHEVLGKSCQRSYCDSAPTWNGSIANKGWAQNIRQSNRSNCKPLISR